MIQIKIKSLEEIILPKKVFNNSSLSQTLKIKNYNKNYFPKTIIYYCKNETLDKDYNSIFNRAKKRL